MAAMKRVIQLEQAISALVLRSKRSCPPPQLEAVYRPRYASATFATQVLASKAVQTTADQDGKSRAAAEEANELKCSVKSQLKVSPRHDLAMVYTCKVCETRSMKTICRESYEKGVVVVRCSGCDNLHLIADRLGWFGEPGSIEDFLSSRGEEVNKASLDSLNFTLQQYAGKEPFT